MLWIIYKGTDSRGDMSLKVFPTTSENKEKDIEKIKRASYYIFVDVAESIQEG